MTSVIWYLGIALIMAAGWARRDQQYLVAESGLGYWFGIIGGSMMLLMLLYPLRKRFQQWSMIGSVKSWFRIHMILGVAGPLIVIFHSGFKLGSFNSSVALFCMLLVAGSGLMGRYIYQRIHHGLFGSKVRFEEFYRDDELASLLLSGAGGIDFGIVDELDDIKEKLTYRHTGINRSIVFYRKMRSRIDRLARDVSHSGLGQAEKKEIRQRLQDLRQICVLGINEILFSYWHLLHLPLFVVMVLSGLIHVAVVHLY
jgi:hypothetical protein